MVQDAPVYFFDCSVFFPRTSFCEARYERSGWNDSQISACSARYSENAKKSSLRWFFSSRRASSTRDFEHGRLQHGDYVLDSSLWRSVDEVPTTTLAMLHIAGLEHEDADLCVWFSDVKANVAFTSAKASSNETGLLPEKKLRELCLDDVVGKVGDIVQAFSKDTDNQ